MKKFVAMLLVVAIAVSLVGCGSAKREKEILKTLDRFEAACHSLDVNAILDCLDPDYARPISGVLSVVSLFTDTSEWLPKAFNLLFGQDEDPEQFMSAVTFENPEVSSKKSNAVVEADLTANVAGRVLSYKVEVKMIYEKDKDEWYISGIHFVK